MIGYVWCLYWKNTSVKRRGSGGMKKSCHWATKSHTDISAKILWPVAERCTEHSRCSHTTVWCTQHSCSQHVSSSILWCTSGYFTASCWVQLCINNHSPCFTRKTQPSRWDRPYWILTCVNTRVSTFQLCVFLFFFLWCTLVALKTHWTVAAVVCQS